MVMLILYEFEAKAKLGSATDLNVCLDSAAALSYAGPQTFETLAGQYGDMLITFYKNKSAISIIFNFIFRSVQVRVNSGK